VAGEPAGRISTVNQPNGLHHMSVDPHSTKRDAHMTRLTRSWRHRQLIAGLSKTEWSLLLLLVCVTNIIVATVAWYVVGSLMR
jgi:hypothetical protein